MDFSVSFQYLRPGDARPLNQCQDELIEVEGGTTVPIPDVGDTVAYLEGGKSVFRKVLTRHFGFFGGICYVNCVVGDVPAAEQRARLKE